MDLHGLTDRLRWLLDKRGTNQTRMSMLAGLSPGYVGLILKGHLRNPSEESIRKIARAGRISETWLTEGTGAPEVVPTVEVPYIEPVQEAPPPPPERKRPAHDDVATAALTRALARLHANGECSRTERDAIEEAIDESYLYIAPEADPDEIVSDLLEAVRALSVEAPVVGLWARARDAEAARRRGTLPRVLVPEREEAIAEFRAARKAPVDDTAARLAVERLYAPGFDLGRHHHGKRWWIAFLAKQYDLARIELDPVASQRMADESDAIVARWIEESYAIKDRANEEANAVVGGAHEHHVRHRPAR